MCKKAIIASNHQPLTYPDSTVLFLNFLFFKILENMIFLLVSLFLKPKFLFVLFDTRQHFLFSAVTAAVG